MMKVADEVWSDHLKPLVDNFLDLVGTVINGALRIYNQAILPIVNWLNDKLGPVVKTVLKGVVTQWGNMVKNVTDYVNKVIKVWKSIVSFITDVFTGDWESAWEDVKDIFSGVCDALGTLFKAPINLIIAGFNKLLSGIEWVVNSLVDALNSISIDVPSVLQDIVGFDKFCFDLDNISIPQIPALAKGTVVPANYGSFLAVMGDNKKEPEVVSPYSTIVQAVKDAQGGAKGPMTINLYLQTRQGIRAVSSAVIDDINDITNSTGVNPVFM
jgi:phage-related protein